MVKVHPSAIVDGSAELQEDVVIGPNCIIGKGVVVGAGTVLNANVVVEEDVVIGKNNQLFSGCVIGGMPQVLGFGADAEFGKVVIGDNNTIREQTTIHPSISPDGLTQVGNENLIMIGVHIGHDCIIGDKVVLSNYAQISGHCNIGTGVWFSGMVLLHQFITVGRWCYAAGLAGINHDVPPFLMVSGHYPPQVRGVNRRGLSRGGFSEEEQKRIVDAYKRLYRRRGPLLENAKALAQEGGLDENVREMVDVIIKSSEHRYGRYLENFRH